MIKVYLSLVLSFSILSSACAHSPSSLKNLRTKQILTMDQVVDQIPLGTILVVGESHAIAGQSNVDQKNQYLLIQKLVSKHQNVSVGMEFIHWKFQNELDQFLDGKVSETQFLKEIGWSSANPFEDYKSQIFEVLEGKGWAFALNAPKELTSFVGKNGLSALPADLKAFLPPNFNLGNAGYKQRFVNLMGDMSSHGVNLDFYFQAQSIWDDSMAWKAVEIMKANPLGILVIIVGKFHATYGGGLPSRIIERGHPQVLTLIQRGDDENSSLDPSNDFLFSKDYGILSDYYW